MRRVAVVVAALVVLAACGDDDALSLDDYFAELAAAGQAYRAAGDVVEAGLDQTTDPLTDVKRLLPDFEPELDGFIEKLEGMAAPEAAAAAHDRAVTAGRAAADAYDDLLAGLEDITDLNGLMAFFEGPEFTAFGAAGERFSAACGALQTVADEENVDVDLNCG